MYWLQPRPVLVFDSLDSTNAEALRSIERGAAPFLVLAERQTAGRGRRGRWSVLCRKPLLQPRAAYRWWYAPARRPEPGGGPCRDGDLERDLGIAGAGLKWPNDVLVGEKKIAGILLELVGDPADVCHVVLGVGINVNMQEADEVDQQWTSMYLEAGRAFDRNLLVVTPRRRPRAPRIVTSLQVLRYCRRSGSKGTSGKGVRCR